MTIPPETGAVSIACFEKCTEELESLIYALYPGESIKAEHSYVDGPNGERTPVCVIRERSPLSIDGTILYIRIGERILLDNFLPNEVYSVVSQFPPDKVTRFGGHVSNLTYQPQQDYALSTMFALGEVGVDGKCVLDAGCADGIQGVMALKKGAKQVIGIENNSQKSWNSLNNFLLYINGIPDFQFTFLNGDFITLKQIGKLDQVEPDCVVANIGPHYGDTHLQVIDYAGETASVMTFVGGGYGGRIYPTDDAYEALTRNGFHIIAEYHHDRSLAFIATKDC